MMMVMIREYVRVPLGRGVRERAEYTVAGFSLLGRRLKEECVCMYFRHESTLRILHTVGLYEDDHRKRCDEGLESLPVHRTNLFPSDRYTSMQVPVHWTKKAEGKVL